MKTNTIDTFCFFKDQFKNEVEVLDDIFIGEDLKLSFPKEEEIYPHRISALLILYQMRFVKVALLFPFFGILLFGCANILFASFDNFAEMLLLAVSYIVVLSGFYLAYLKRQIHDTDLKILRMRFIVSGLSPLRDRALSDHVKEQIGNDLTKRISRDLCIYEAAHLLGCKEQEGGTHG